MHAIIIRSQYYILPSTANKISSATNIKHRDQPELKPAERTPDAAELATAS